MKPGTAKTVSALIDAAVRGDLDEAQALRLCAESPELVTLALLAAGKRIAQQYTQLANFEGQGGDAQSTLSTPSGMVPVYAKTTTPRRHKKPAQNRGARAVGERHPRGSTSAKRTV